MPDQASDGAGRGTDGASFQVPEAVRTNAPQHTFLAIWAKGAFVAADISLIGRPQIDVTAFAIRSQIQYHHTQFLLVDCASLLSSDRSATDTRATKIVIAPQKSRAFCPSLAIDIFSFDRKRCKVASE